MHLLQLNNIKNTLLIVFTCLFCCKSEIKTQKINYQRDYIPFIDHSKNVIEDKDNSLKHFYEQLFNLHTVSSSNVIPKVISILHIGDSHVQADFMTGKIREIFQSDFGNAGRGLIAPLKLANTNEPRDYSITSPEKWTASRCIQTYPIFPPGITGMTIACDEPECELEISLLRSDNYFRKITVFHAPDENLFINCPNKGMVRDYASTTFNLPTAVSSVQIGMESINRSTLELQGFSLETGERGILYHAVGINGAHFLDYVDKELFLSQSKQLQPALIIISLGTNDAYRRNFSSSALYDHIDMLITALKKNNPEATFLLTTPAGGFRKQKKGLIPNDNIDEVSRMIKKYAETNKLAYWDLHQLSGNSYASENWLESGLMSKDGVHFTREGYAVQGNLLYQAIINGYNRLFSDRLE